MSFPSSPTNGQTAVLNGVVYSFNSTSNSWTKVASGVTATNTLVVVSTQSSTSTVTGALTVGGGVGIGGNLYVASTSYVAGAVIITTATIGTYASLGPSGAQGVQGTQGLQGVQGLTGTQGVQGLQGIQGLQGQTGSTGTQGVQGLQGLQGSTGTQGIQGLQGVQGVSGFVGSTGTQGTQGIQGLQGLQGSTGAQGIQGLIGTQGLQGLQGIAGTAGSTGTFSGVTTSTVQFTNTTATTSTNTGALTVSGGVGIGGNLYVGGTITANQLTIQNTTITQTTVVSPDIFTITNTTVSSNTQTGALVIAGGVGVGGNVNIGGTVTGGGIRSTSTSTPPSNPVVGDIWYDTTSDIISRYTTDGTGTYWLDIVGPTISNPYYGGTVTQSIIPNIGGTYDLGSDTNRFRTLYVTSSTIDIGGVALSVAGGNLQVGGAPLVASTTGTTSTFIVSNKTTATSTTTAALTVAGGIGVGGNVIIGSASTASIVGLTVGTTDAIALPMGTTAQRPASTSTGMIRYNSDNGAIEGYVGTGWGIIISGGTFLASNLSLYYDFGNASCYSGSGSTVTDLSGNGHTGTLQNSPTYSASNGGIFNFSASNQYISTSYLLPAAPRSHGYWVKCNNFASFPSGLFIAGTQEGGAYTYLGVYGGAGGEIYYYLGNNTGGNTTGYALTTGVWYHLFETISASGAMNVYKNGVAVVTTSGSAGGAAASSTFGVGALGGGGYPLTNGSIGKVTVYNIELTASQVLSNFNADKSRYGY
jgi:hypothetical protein